MANPYFNAVYYLTQNPDVFAAGYTVDTAWDHYAQYGANEAYAIGGTTRAPNPWFDAKYYLNNNPDLIAAGVTPANALNHFFAFGGTAAEDRAPNATIAANPITEASLLAYAKANADLLTAFGIAADATELTVAQQNNLITQFYAFGYSEDRPSAPTTVDQPDPNQGETFTLTSAIGEIVNGTTGNDTFKGVLGAASTDSTFQIGDTIDGKTGTDTFELIVDKGTALPAGAQVSNVENIVVTNGASSLGAIDASVFAGSEKIVLKNNATAVTVSNMSGKTLGVEGVAAAKVTGDFGAAATTAALALNGAKGAVDLTGAAVKTVNISGGSQVDAGVVQTVTVAGTATAAATAINVDASAPVNLNISAAAAATKLTVTGSGTANLGTLHAVAKTVDASANTGGVTVSGGAALQEVTGGSGKDSVTLAVALADKGFVKTDAGNDSVILGASAVNKGAVIELGAGDDSITGTGVIDKDAIIDGGEGTDTLALELVGATNVGAFKNFEVFDVAGMTNKTLDLDILASNNTVQGITGSGVTAGAATLTNLGAGVGFTAIKNMIAAGTVTVKTAPVPVATEILTLTQKTAGAMTVSLDSDSTSTTTANDAAVAVVATNATSLKAEFASDSGFVQTAGAVATENNQAIVLTGTKATTLEVVSGGTNATNLLSYTVGAGSVVTDGVLTSATVSGSQALTLDFDHAALVSKLATVDASTLTGGLTIELADLANAGTVKLGSGADVVQVADGAAPIAAADVESVVNFSKAASKEAADVAKADLLDFTASALTVGTGVTTGDASAAVKGVVSFLGTGPTTLDEAIDFVDALGLAANSAVVFNYLSDSYAFIETGANDQVVKLVGVTGVAELAVNASGDAYIL